MKRPAPGVDLLMEIALAHPGLLRRSRWCCSTARYLLDFSCAASSATCWAPCRSGMVR
jgi:hypothetical protein